MKKMVIVLVIMTLIAMAAFAVSSQGASVPLPEDVKIVKPRPDVPPEIAAFSGRWEGNWDRTLDVIIIVEEITNTEAKVIHAWGDAPEWNVKKITKNM